jgi:hypothetical protein
MIGSFRRLIEYFGGYGSEGAAAIRYPKTLAANASERKKLIGWHKNLEHKADIEFLRNLRPSSTAGIR